MRTRARQGKKSRLAEVCIRCKRPIERDDQSCVFKGQRWPCVSASDKSVIEADGLRIKTGWDVNPIPLLKDPYAE